MPAPKKVYPESLGFARDKLRRRGFTLIELLVVISIISILAVIGITIYSGVQKNARDTKRRGDIEAISKALEVHYGDPTCGATSTTYCPLQNTWFSSGGAPTKDSSGLYYCIAYPSGGSPNPLADAATTGWGSAASPVCPSGYAGVNPGNNPTADTLRWKACTLLETGSVFCRNSQR